MAATIAVVLNFNDAESTLRCVRSIVAADYISEILVVDNGSMLTDFDLLVTGVNSLPSHVRVVQIDTNLGFGGGMNVGIALALESKADSILLLNNDTVASEDAVLRLRDALSADRSLGVAVPLITTGDGSIVWSAGGWTDPASLRTVAHGAGQAVQTLDLQERCNFAPGAALLVRPEVFRAVGGFAEKLFLYVEDLELCMRISAAGFGFEVVPDSEIWHAVQGGSTTRTAHSVYFRVRNSLWLARSGAGSYPRACLVPIVLLRGVRTALRTCKGQPSLTPSAIKNLVRGIRDGLLTRQPGEKLEPTIFGI